MPEDHGGVPGPDAFHNFGALLQGLEEGRLNATLSAEAEDLVRLLADAIESDRGAEGAITVTIKLKAFKGVIEASGDYKVKLPKQPRGRSIFHIAGGRFLSRKDPRQPDLPLRTVAEKPTEMRNV